MAGTVIDNCSKCGDECVLGINAIMDDGKVVCDECANVKRGFAGLLLPEERKALQETLQQDLREYASTYRSELIKALEDTR